MGNIFLISEKRLNFKIKKWGQEIEIFFSLIKTKCANYRGAYVRKPEVG